MHVLLGAISLWSCIVCSLAQDMSTVFEQSPFNRLKIEWGVSGRKGKRDDMQDAYAVQSRDDQIIFSLYDGHGGADAAIIAADKLPNEIFKHGECIAYPCIDRAIENSGHTSGTTAVTARIVPQDNGNYELVLAWVGDSRAVLVHEDGLPSMETVDHKPGNYFEKMRIKRAGGRIYSQIYQACDGREKKILRVARKTVADCNVSEQGRCAGGISLTRALGDARWPNAIISPNPEIFSCILSPGHDGYLILASDGLWDKLSSNRAERIVSRMYPCFESMDSERMKQLADDDEACHQDGEQTHEAGSAISAIFAARALRDIAYHAASSDNITAMVVRFMWEQKHGAAHDGFQGPTAVQELGGTACCIL